MNPPVIRAEGLVKRYRRRRVVDEVSLEVHAGEICGLLGPNGAGKTTTFNIIAGRVRADGGRVFLEGRDVTRLPMHRRARAGLGYLPQEASIFRRLTVRENFLAVMEICGVPRRERAARVERLIEEFDLGHVAGARGETLSGGERRRAEVARSLIPGPRVILFDEPFAGVDPIAVAELQRLIVGLKARGISVLITDHNVRETLGICDRATILVAGRVLTTGTPEEVAASPEARSLYLGDRFALDRLEPRPQVN
ncbi:MAG: LPS export ABC transporter ATP-binding protein [Deltaproteobacteria bacterium]|nr:MAG: LPS export ABC transporter ATP-binding protein [Deltaproteobacteria bacterium]